MIEVKVKGALAKILQSKEDNLIYLYFDYEFRLSSFPKYAKQIVDTQEEIDVETDKGIKKNKEKLLKLEEKLKYLKETQKTLIKEIQTVEGYIVSAENYLDHLKEIINDPKKLVDFYDKKKKDN